MAENERLFHHKFTHSPDPHLDLPRSRARFFQDYGS